jgi:hypothetical protein
VAAANGNIRAQQNYLSLLIGAEADRRVATMELLKTAVDYKEHWHHILAERARKGTTGPEQFLTPTTSSSTSIQAKSDSMARLTKNRRRRRIGCAPCGLSWNDC